MCHKCPHQKNGQPANNLRQSGVASPILFFKLKRSKLFRQLASTLTSLFLVRVKESSKKKAPRPKYLSMTQLMPLERQEVKGAMKLSLLRRRSCYKNAKGQRYLGVGENNSLTLGLAFRNICSQSVAKRSLKLPAHGWTLDYSKRKTKTKAFYQIHLQQTLNCLEQLSSYYQFAKRPCVKVGSRNLNVFSNKFCHQNLLL